MFTLFRRQISHASQTNKRIAAWNIPLIFYFCFMIAYPTKCFFDFNRIIYTLAQFINKIMFPVDTWKT